MASIQKHSSGRSPYWFAKFQDESGRVVVVSTKIKHSEKGKKDDNKEAAKAVAAKLEEAAEQARRGIAREGLFRRVLSDMLERVTGETLRNPSVKEYLEGWLRVKERAKKEGTHTRYDGTVKIFLKHLELRATKPIRTITTKDLESFMETELGAGKAASTVNVDIKTLRTAFNAAFKQNLIDHNPVAAVEPAKEDRHKREAFTRGQIRSILDSAEGEWKTAIMFGYFVGARIGDAVNMTWENIDLVSEDKYVNYTQQKTGRKASVPLSEELETHLLSLPIQNRDPKASLTPKLAAREVGGRNGLSRDFKLIMEKANVSDGRIEAEGDGVKGRAFSALSFHSLRHSFVSHLAEQGVTAEVRMKLSGHTSEDVHEKYSGELIEPMKKAIAKLTLPPAK